MASTGTPNRLINETSPYLLQHAHNPVDWYPWGADALSRARIEEKPILLSIGYAACHWCHVMEKESFEDPETARLMNESFVCIKVDREERPDIDSIYMDAVQAITGHGGWPMTMFLTPDGVPFYGGTYFPREDRHGLPSFKRVLVGVSEAWIHKRQEIETEGQKLVSHIAALTSPRPSQDQIDHNLFDEAAEQISATFDPIHAGFGGPPKFPQAPVLEFMILNGHAGREQSREQVQRTLTSMALGGIYDQLGGGFHRYAVDREWLVPHFEKMLYDNAQLARAYTHAWQAFRDPLYERIARETCDYMLRDLRDPSGGFHSSEDADSEGEEGTFYVWPYDQFASIAPGALNYYGVTEGGNFEGRNILTANGAEPPHEDRQRLFELRNERIRPAKDDKVLASWNGLAIAALAEAGAAFQEPSYLIAAAEAANMVLAEMSPSGSLRHSYRQGVAKVPGLLEDYAYLADGLFMMWEATFEPRWVDECRRIVDEMIDKFSDPASGGFFTASEDHDGLIVRQKELIESATPSPNAVAATVMLKLAVLTGEQSYERQATGVLRLSLDLMRRAPQAVATSLLAADRHLRPATEIVIVGETGSDKVADLTSIIWSRYIPRAVRAGAPPGIESPMLEGRLETMPLAYVCESYACQKPTDDPDELIRQLEASSAV